MTKGQESCQHEKVMPKFDAVASRGLSDTEVRKRWPRFHGTCPDCGLKNLTLYASVDHYIAGDW